MRFLVYGLKQKQSKLKKALIQAVFLFLKIALVFPAVRFIFDLQRHSTTIRANRPSLLTLEVDKII
jgi:hypothetical protein